MIGSLWRSLRILVIGGSGLIGRPLVQALMDCGHTVEAPSHAEFDLINPPDPLPHCDAVYFTAGPKGFRPCEGNSLSYRINVDGVLQVGIELMRLGTKLVFVSTDAVEWSAAAYATQKRLAEIGLMAAGSPAIVRPERVSADNVDNLVALLVKVMDRPGIHRWP